MDCSAHTYLANILFWAHLRKYSYIRFGNMTNWISVSNRHMQKCETCSRSKIHDSSAIELYVYLRHRIKLSNIGDTLDVNGALSRLMYLSAYPYAPMPHLRTLEMEWDAIYCEFNLEKHACATHHKSNTAERHREVEEHSILCKYPLTCGTTICKINWRPGWLSSSTASQFSTI